MRTRFAPSPTGYLHVGGARAALLNWLLARRAGGSFLLRIEDTDAERNVPGAEAQLLDELRWLGIDWDEGPDIGGPFGPYRQSERLPIYRDLARRLLVAGRAYLCDCPAATEAAPEARTRCPCADRPAGGDVPAGSSVRFRIPDQETIAFHDEIRGRIEYPGASIEDWVLLRSDGRPTYNFAAAADDAAMRIDLVVRGSDHIANTPKQILVHQAFGWGVPRYAHIPLILGPDRQKLSKRHGATSVGEHRRRGYLPEAMVNYLSLLSWSSPSGEEFLPLDRLRAEVDLGRIGASDAIFDDEKLRWLSHRYIQALSPDEFARRAEPFLDPTAWGIDPAELPVALELVRERISLLSEIGREILAFAGDRSDDQRAAMQRASADPALRPVLDALRTRLERDSTWNPEAIGAAIRAAGSDAGARGKGLFQPIRLALTGDEHGPDLARVAFLLGRERVLSRLSSAEGV